MARASIDWEERLPELSGSRPSVSVRPLEDHRRGQGRPEPSDEPPPGTTAGIDPSRYVLKSVIGQGGMGMVWLASQRSLNRDVALKVVRDGLSGKQRGQFRTEAVCTSALEHPNIVPIYDAGDGFIAMKRIEGDSLESLLIDGGLALPQVVEILIKVCDALSFAHARGVIHRDVKPDNIMVGRFGEVVLMDWGLAMQFRLEGGRTVLERGDDRRALCAGTPGYLAPEVARADAAAIGPATDVFLLGATLYRCLSGRLPFDGGDALGALQLSAENDWPPLGQLGCTVPPRLAALQEQSMAGEPGRRPGIAEFQATMRHWLMSANAEAEAQRCLERGQGLLAIARGAGRRSDEAYAAYNEALQYLDRAVVLCPDRFDLARVRDDAVHGFAWSAASAGEPGLARLLRRSGRLPAAAASGASEDDNRRLAASLAWMRRHVTDVSTRLGEVEERLARRNAELNAWRLGATLVGILAAIAVVVAAVSAFR